MFSFNSTWKVLTVSSAFAKKSLAQGLVQPTRKFSGTSSLNKSKLAIFDRTGTLHSFDAMWAQWCEDTAKKFSVRLKCDMSDEFYNIVKYDPATKRILKGGLCEKPHRICQNRMIKLLVSKHELTEHIAFDIVRKNWDHKFKPPLDRLDEYIKPLGDIKGSFEKLKNEGVHIAICTSDSREGSDNVLECMEISKYVDIMICGDDKGRVRKPDPATVYQLCEKFDITPKEVAVVGDTQTDVKLGVNAKCGLVVGILCGVCSKEDLQPYAHYVVEDVEASIPLILGETPV